MDTPGVLRRGFVVTGRVFNYRNALTQLCGACVLACCWCSFSRGAELAAEPLRVLTLRSTSSFVASMVYDQAMLDALTARVSGPVEVYTELVDPLQYPGVDMDQELQALFQKKYAPRKIDLIMASGRAALAFAERNRDKVWPQVPVVFYNVLEEALDGRSLPQQFTGITIQFSPERTLELATRLHPEARHLLIVSGADDYDKRWLKRTAPLIRSYESRFKTTHLTNLSMPQIVAEARKVTPDSIILILSVVRDATGRQYGAADAARQVSEAASAPVYAILELAFGQGVVGGWAPSLREQGALAGELAAQVVSAGAGARIPVQASPPVYCAVDQRQLKRWHISESLVPSECSTQFQEPSFWETYRWYIVSALAVILLQALLIAALLINRARRVRSEKALDERLAFERLISDVSARLINARFENVDDEIEKALMQVLRIMDLDRCSLCAHESSQGALRITHSVDASGAPSVARNAGQIELPWLVRELDRGATVVLNDVARDLPDDAAGERSYAQKYGLKSLIVVPVAAAGEAVVRGVSYQSTRHYRNWTPAVVSRLQLVSEMLVTALAEKLAGSALRASEEQLRLALQAGRLGIWEWDRSTNIVKWSQAHFGIADDTPSSTELAFDAWQAQVHSDDVPRMQAAFRRAVEDKTDVRCEYRFARTEGRYQWTDMQASPTFASDGRCIRVIGLTADISDRKRVEEANVRLAHVSRLASMGELTGSIAHEINQPLGAILNNADAAEMMLRSSKPSLDEVRHIVTDIRSDALRAGEVIRHIRALMRKSELTIQPFDLNQAVSDVLNLVAVDLGKRRIAVTQDVAPLPIVHGDKIHAQQVVLNLIQNAADAMVDSPSSRRLEIRTGPSAEGGVEIAVSDSGHGIPADRMKRLFESFYTTKKEGMGLGLSIARSIVEAHGGRILAENRSGGGATFRVFLPLNPATVRIRSKSPVDARAGVT